MHIASISIFSSTIQGTIQDRTDADKHIVQSVTGRGYHLNRNGVHHI